MRYIFNVSISTESTTPLPLPHRWSKKSGCQRFNLDRVHHTSSTSIRMVISPTILHVSISTESTTPLPQIWHYGSLTENRGFNLDRVHHTSSTFNRKVSQLCLLLFQSRQSPPHLFHSRSNWALLMAFNVSISTESTTPLPRYTKNSIATIPVVSISTESTTPLPLM